MHLPERVTATLGRASDAFQPVVRFSKLERVLATVCFFAPLVLIGFDSWHVRDSISAYYDMGENQWFYVLFMVVAMLFIVNGVIKTGHFYNTLLGLALSGVVLFNKDDITWLHFLFAAGFFVGNGLVVLFSEGLSDRAKWFYTIGIGAPLVLNWAFDVVPLFWAEWLSFAIITVHYVADTLKTIPGTNKQVPYRAIQRRQVRLAK